MKKRLIILKFLLLIGCAEYVNAQTDFKAGFLNPPASAKAETWWHWLDGNISKKGITADLEAMKRVGIEKAEIFNVSADYPQGYLYLSKDWLDMLAFAASEAKRLHMHLGFHNGSGWSSSGGPWVKPEFAMQTIVYSKVELVQGEKFDHQLPQPTTRFGYYRDIVILAFPTPKGNYRIDDLPVKSLSGDLFKTNLEPEERNIPDSAVIQKSRLIDLTSRLSSDGKLNWNPPAGNWTILRIGHTPNGKENHPAVAGGKGLECDKMSRTALDAYWAGGVQPIINKLGTQIGTTVTDCLIDSYEVGCNNWTPLFRGEFKKRRGYDCLAYLPALAGYYVDGNDVTERFLWDFRKTVSDLVADNYYGHFSELCRKYKLNFAVEPYGGPFDSHAAGAHADMVMAEFWFGKQLFLSSPKLASSIAHINGMRYAGSESFTGFGGWIAQPAALKPIGDRVWTEGINRFIIHSYVHQPWDHAPGLTLGGYGIELNRMNTWWEQSKPFFTYIARAQYLLQQGHSTADVLVFNGEWAPNEGIIRSDIKAAGYDYDQIGDREFYSLKVIKGKLFTAHSGPYQLLVLPDTKWATPRFLAKLDSLVSEGAVVKGRRPEKSPGLYNYPLCDRQVATFAAQLWSKKIQEATSAADIANCLSHAQISPDFDAGSTGSDLSFIHRAMNNKDVYFIANPQNFARTGRCRFRVSGKVPEFWDAETGSITKAAVWQQLNNHTIEVPVPLSAHGSVFVVFDQVRKSQPHLTQLNYTVDASSEKTLPGLQITSATYGKFLPEGVVDVTDAVNRQIAAHGLHVSAGNWLSPADPAPGSMKELRLVYYTNNQIHTKTFLENENSGFNEDTAGFHLVQALYGKFNADFKQMPVKAAFIDVTGKVRDLIDAGKNTFLVSGELFNVNSKMADAENELHITYRANNSEVEVKAADGHRVVLAAQQPEPQISLVNNIITLTTSLPGTVKYRINSGKKIQTKDIKIPAPTEINKGWQVSFPINKRHHIDTTFNELTAWSLTANNDIRYFSGTAVYKRDFTIAQEMLDGSRSLLLSLGEVKDIAHVLVNGKDAGILWKAPFITDISKYLKPGVNHLEISVTNLWKNRLIGDERFPDDQGFGNGKIKQWPAWVTDTTVSRNSERVAFTTHKYYNKDTELEPSGLLGTVELIWQYHIKLN